MPENAGLLRVWEGRDKMIYEEKIPDPPQLQWKDRYPTQEGMGLEWEPKPGYEEQDILYLYLVQFEDRPGVWRGIAPRSQAPKIVVPWEFFRRRKQLHVRILASSGIATGGIDDRITPEKPPDNLPPATPPDQPPVVVSPNGPLEPGKIVGPYLRAVSEGAAWLRWYDESGAELSGSATLDLRGFPDGQHTIRAVSIGAGSLQSTYSLLLEKEGDRVTFLRDFKPAQAGEPHVHPHPKRGDKKEHEEK
jgi:hypothetical protein